MIKNGIILLYMGIILLFQLLYDYNVTITQNIPESAEPGSEFLVEITIDKGDIEGFGKIQQDLPPGFIALPNATPGASFTFSEQKVKIIWMALPSKSEFTISYKIQVNKDVAGIKTIGGKFSYLENSERHSIDIPEKQIRVGDISVSELAEENNEESTEAQVEITCNRSITQNKNNNKEYTVELSVYKNGINGFAKIQEILPIGFSATVLEANNAVFSFVDQKAKYVWMTLPENAEYKVSYLIKNEGGNVDELNRMEGEFAYLQNGETKKAAIVNSKPLIAEVKKQEIIIEQPTTEIKDDKLIVKEESKPVQEIAVNEDKKETLEQKTEKQPEEIKQEIKSSVPPVKITPTETIAGMPKKETKQELIAKKEERNTSLPLITSIPTPSNGINYRVQIAAGHKPVEENHFKVTYKFLNDVILENHEGWIKYTTGSHEMYKIARDHRNEITPNYKFKGPFVTAYNNGIRITIQEALMITNQKWYK